MEKVVSFDTAFFTFSDHKLTIVIFYLLHKFNFNTLQKERQVFINDYHTQPIFTASIEIEPPSNPFMGKLTCSRPVRKAIT